MQMMATITAITWGTSISSRPTVSSWPRPPETKSSSPASSARHAKLHPSLRPVTMPGSAAGSSTPKEKRGPRTPSVWATRMSCGSIPLTPSSVAMAMESTLPITTTKRMAASVRPNHSSASGSQQMEGSACSPITTGFTALRKKASRALASPSGTPMATEMR